MLLRVTGAMLQRHRAMARISPIAIAPLARGVKLRPRPLNKLRYGEDESHARAIYPAQAGIAHKLPWSHRPEWLRALYTFWATLRSTPKLLSTVWSQGARGWSSSSSLKCDGGWHTRRPGVDPHMPWTSFHTSASVGCTPAGQVFRLSVVRSSTPEIYATGLRDLRPSGPIFGPTTLTERRQPGCFGSSSGGAYARVD